MNEMCIHRGKWCQYMPSPLLPLNNEICIEFIFIPTQLNKNHWLFYWTIINIKSIQTFSNRSFNKLTVLEL